MLQYGNVSKNKNILTLHGISCNIIISSQPICFSLYYIDKTYILTYKN